MHAATRTTWAARGLGLLALVLLGAGWAISGVEDVGSDVFISALAVVCSAVGVLVASRHPGSATGWLFLGVGVSTGLGTLAGSYADAWVAGGQEGSRRLGELAAWYGTLSWMPFILVPCTFVLLLFPDGRLLSPRWRWVAWCAGAGIAGVFISTGLKPGPLEDQPTIDNPLGVDSPLLAPLTGLSVVLLAIGMVGSAASAVVRFRRAQGERRQQMKWLALAGTVVAVTVPVAVLGSDGLWDDTVVNIACMVAVLGLPIAAGIAILRHRLYDIDVVINRTLVYGALTATLAAAYLVLVLLIGLAVGRSGLAVAVSTLAVAALFGPARARYPGRGRPPLLPPPLRRRADARGVRRPAPGRARPRGARGRHARRRRRHGAARARLAVAARACLMYVVRCRCAPPPDAPAARAARSAPS